MCGGAEAPKLRRHRARPPHGTVRAPGDAKVGEPCSFASQCESLACSSVWGTCGVCARIIPDGEACSQEDFTAVCAPSSDCVEGKCRPLDPSEYLPAGSTCPSADGRPCTFGTSCVALTPHAPSGTCMVQPGEGRACVYHVGSSFSACADALRCSRPDESSPDGTCVSKAALGESCTEVPCETELVCHPTTSRCEVGQGLDEPCTLEQPCRPSLTCVTASVGAGVCKERPTVGQTCDRNVGCVPPATCEAISRDGGSVNVCVTHGGGRGASCDEVHRCDYRFECREGICQLELCPDPDAGTDG